MSDQIPAAEHKPTVAAPVVALVADAAPEGIGLDAGAAPEPSTGAGTISAPSEPQKVAMQHIADALDTHFNGTATGKDRPIGFVLLFYKNGSSDGLANFISNGASRSDIVLMFKEMIRRFEPMSDADFVLAAAAPAPAADAPADPTSPIAA